uniref:disease resistance protein Roq1-like n=1 Tax=Erigeron canadensis TaxID=72917 RepID=UPI001CB966E8|nr:disease resistance protein Roq1-like [Erigeron canadensis]
MSFDELSIAEKKILLYIACFFKGRDRRYVTRILDSCGFKAGNGITKLIEKSFLTITKGRVHMHDLIQEMSRCIARKDYPNTMAWVTQEIKETLKTSSRLEAVEAIVETNHDQSSGRPMPYCSAKVFMGMKKLRLLEVNNYFTSSEPAAFPEELRWLCWSDYPYQSLIITRGMTNLVGLELPYSDILQVQMEKEVILTSLKSINLNRSYMITSFPDISGVPNLERLNLSCCMQLREVHQSVLNHEKIIHLDLTGCMSLRSLPSPIKMKNLSRHSFLIIVKISKDYQKSPWRQGG